MINYLLGQNDTLMRDVHFEYSGGESPNFSIDRLSAIDSEILYYSDDGHGRIFLKDQEYGFKAISSTILAAALRNGDSLSMKPYFFAEMIDYMLGISSVTSIRETFENIVSGTRAFPNPAIDHINISFDVRKSVQSSITIMDKNGRSVFSRNLGYFSPGAQTISWNLTDNNGSKLPAGNYFYTISAGSDIRSGKIVVVK
jgi:hypothetical protein